MEIIDFTEYGWRLRKKGAIHFYKPNGDTKIIFTAGALMMFKGEPILQTKNLWGDTVYLKIDLTKLADAFGNF